MGLLEYGLFFRWKINQLVWIGKGMDMDPGLKLVVDLASELVDMRELIIISKRKQLPVLFWKLQQRIRKASMS